MDRESEKTVKKYLYKLKNLDNLIRCKRMEIADMELIAVAFGIDTDNIRVQTSNRSDKVADCAVKLADMKAEAIELCHEWAQLKIKVNRTLNRMSDNQQVIVLNMYYCQNKTFEEIAEFMDFSYQWVYKIYKDALEEFEKCMDDEVGSCEHLPAEIYHGSLKS